MINDPTPIRARLKQARQEARMKQETVARYLKIPTSAVSAFESGHRKLDAIELYMLSKLYRKPMEWFFNDLAEYRFISQGSRSAAQPEGETPDPLIDECLSLLKKAPSHLRKSAAYGIIGFLSDR